MILLIAPTKLQMDGLKARLWPGANPIPPEPFYSFLVGSQQDYQNLMAFEPMQVTRVEGLDGYPQTWTAEILKKHMGLEVYEHGQPTGEPWLCVMPGMVMPLGQGYSPYGAYTDWLRASADMAERFAP